MAKKLRVGDSIRGYRVTKIFGPGMMAISYAADGPGGAKVFLKQYKSPSPAVIWYPQFVDYQQELSRRVKALVVTRGAQGSDLYVDGGILHIPVAGARNIVDPIGCGDAYRGGLLYGIAHHMDWETAGRLAAVMGSIKIEASGAQNYMADRASIGERFWQAFGYRPW